MENEQELDVTKLKYVLYARKSTDDPERQATSIPDQIAECQKLAHNKGLHIIDTLKESKSAKFPNNRPVFNQMLKDIRSSKFDGILAWNPDRLARNMLEAGTIIDMIDQGVIKDLKFVTHYFTKDANGKMLLGMAFVLSKQYSDKLSQDVTRGVRSRFSKSGKTPTPKHGYLNENGVYKPDDEIKENGYSNFDLIGEAWQMRKRGDSIETITEYLNGQKYYRMMKKEGNRKVDMDKRILSEIFHDSFYYGVLVQANQKVDLRELYPDFVPAVSEDDYWVVQQLTYRKFKPSKSHKAVFYPLRLMVLCSHCNKSMVVAPSTSERGKKYLYYRCDNKDCVRKPKSIRAKVIFNFIYDLLKDGLNFTEKEYKEYYENLMAITDEEQQVTRAELHNKQGLLKHTKHEITDLSLNLAHLPEGRAKEEALNKVSSLEEQEIELEGQINNLEKLIRDPQLDQLSIEQFLNLSKNASLIVQSADERVKDIICRQIFLNLTVDEKKVLSYQAKEPFATLIKQRQQRTSRGAGNWTQCLSIPNRAFCR